MTILLVSIFLNPECWWARFVPQAFLIPIFTILFISNRRLQNIILILITINFIYTFVPAVSYCARETLKINSSMSDLKSKKEKLFCKKSPMRSVVLRFKENNILVTEVEDLPKDCSPFLFPSSEVECCFYNK